jgi:hypothetical protein
MYFRLALRGAWVQAENGPMVPDHGELLSRICRTMPCSGVGVTEYLRESKTLRTGARQPSIGSRLQHQRCSIVMTRSHLAHAIAVIRTRTGTSATVVVKGRTGDVLLSVVVVSMMFRWFAYYETAPALSKEKMIWSGAPQPIRPQSVEAGSPSPFDQRTPRTRRAKEGLSAEINYSLNSFLLGTISDKLFRSCHTPIASNERSRRFYLQSRFLNGFNICIWTLPLGPGKCQVFEVKNTISQKHALNHNSQSTSCQWVTVISCP